MVDGCFVTLLRQLKLRDIYNEGPRCRFVYKYAATASQKGVTIPPFFHIIDFEKVVSLLVLQLSIYFFPISTPRTGGRSYWLSNWKGKLRDWE